MIWAAAAVASQSRWNDGYVCFQLVNWAVMDRLRWGRRLNSYPVTETITLIVSIRRLIEFDLLFFLYPPFFHKASRSHMHPLISRSSTRNYISITIAAGRGQTGSIKWIQLLPESIQLTNFQWFALCHPSPHFTKYVQLSYFNIFVNRSVEKNRYHGHTHLIE